MTDKFIKQKTFGAGRRPQSRGQSPVHKRQDSKRRTICSIRTNAAEAKYLQGIKSRTGKSWIEILYRGLGLQRVTRPTNVDELLSHYQHENEK
jgi:hypothetical protein